MNNKTAEEILKAFKSGAKTNWDHEWVEDHGALNYEAFKKIWNKEVSPLKKRIEELETYLRSAQSILYEEQYTGTAEEIEKILNPSTNGKQD